MPYQGKVEFETNHEGQMHDVTSRVQRLVKESGVQTGIAHVFAVGSTAALGTIEFESGLCRDLPATLERLIPPSIDYGHEQAWHDGNGHSHLQASVLGPSLTIPVTDGDLVLGTWQQVFHIECDVKPRRRSVVVTVLGD